jgi:hypothetical protein
MVLHKQYASIHDADIVRETLPGKSEIFLFLSRPKREGRKLWGFDESDMGISGIKFNRTFNQSKGIGDVSSLACIPVFYLVIIHFLGFEA